MPDRYGRPEREMYGIPTFAPCECGQHMVPVHAVTPDEDAALAEWEEELEPDFETAWRGYTPNRGDRVRAGLWLMLFAAILWLPIIALVVWLLS